MRLLQGAELVPEQGQLQIGDRHESLLSRFRTVRTPLNVTSEPLRQPGSGGSRRD
ncbi:hypothetical protein GCM10010468_12020 [Actinocorallia longicatena]|uniref:Uncharacterized protein n=1 Tax=Actinocorallia longicatena TaxID=111803 RepID=A0ABP6Q6M3_9ACTN